MVKILLNNFLILIVTKKTSNSPMDRGIANDVFTIKELKKAIKQ